MKRFDDIRTIFVDLDDTIWDFTANSKVALKAVYERYQLDNQCSYDVFIKEYLLINEQLWSLYHHGKIEKDFLKRERFRASFERCGIICESPERFDYDYLETIVTLKKVVAGAPKLLQHLKKRGSVNILSNGFANLQFRKLQSAGLDRYIDLMVLSDDIGVTKPDKRLFDYALEKAKANAETTLMIGDNYDADILGAYNAGWKTIFFNRRGESIGNNVADLVVQSLEEIIPYL